ncbi:MAG: aminodeoxychorismate synthase component I [Rhizobiales bacterium]|nr:aminodeoxychorismate synthase component I [Hyphomicrobiales bacterium]
MTLENRDHLKYVQAPFVLLDNSLDQQEGGHLFQDPHEIIIAHSLEDIPSAFKNISRALEQGHFVAGYMTYELGLAFEEKLTPQLGKKLEQLTNELNPLLWFGVFKEKLNVSKDDIESWLEEQQESELKNSELKVSVDETFESYKEKFAKVKANIKSGDIYQLNLTFKGRVENISEPLALYEKMRRTQPVEFASLIVTEDKTILSASPELFIRCQNEEIETRPMKGTMKRGISITQDEEHSNFLKADEKSRAENLMIVDLMRNDFSRVSKIGSVEVSNLYHVETYPSLHQMVSVVKAKLKPELSLFDQIKALYPAGSITGAPKIRAMELIEELEDTPRGVYTGAIGFFAPSNDYTFNVAIRTIELDRDGNGTIGIGSGLVYDSDAASEYAECLLKMQFLIKETPEFSLLETMVYSPKEGVVLLEEHLQRLEKSAAYFHYPFDKEKILDLLDMITRQASVNLGVLSKLRLRLLLHKNGNITITPTEIKIMASETVWNITLAPEVMQSKNLFLYHKTTNRDFYDTPRTFMQSRAEEEGSEKIDEVIFQNEKGEITEGSFTNIFVKVKGELITPSIESGLLPGTLRQSLIEQGKAKEKILTLKDLQSADEIYVGNSVRGLIKAKLIG